MQQISERFIEDLALGATVLGTGGGGDPYIGKLMAQAAAAMYGPADLVSVDDLADDALIVPSAMMGAPTVMTEKIPGGEEVIAAFSALQDYLGREITHTMSIEAGGLNSTIPLVVASRLGLPLVDADMMGRAFPELQMCTPTMWGISATPMAIADEKGNTTILKTVDNHWTERLARSICVDMGTTAMIALYVIDGKTLKESCIPGTMTLAAEIGGIIRAARTAHLDPIDAVLERIGGFRLFSGKVVDVQRRTESGFARGEARFAGVDADAGTTLRIRFQNEHLIATRDDTVLATVPDLITVFDADSGEPITTEELRYGFRVVVAGVPCNERWRTPSGLDLVGPRYFGYDLDFVPVEQRVADRLRGS
ncbi:DUF917 domain-containing protein [bacterium]|nr:DUF917 domain-containing protein [bacterium]